MSDWDAQRNRQYHDMLGLIVEMKEMLQFECCGTTMDCYEVIEKIDSILEELGGTEAVVQDLSMDNGMDCETHMEENTTHKGSDPVDRVGSCCGGGCHVGG